MSRMVLGIDPGLTGALAWLRWDGTLVAVADMPALAGEVSAQGLADDDRLRLEMVKVAVLEWPGLMPKNGAKAARSVGMSLATVSTFLTVRGIPTHRVTPGVWKRALNLNADKGRSIALALRLWPDHAADFKRVRDHGRAEAALLAHWWLSRQRPMEVSA